MCEKCGEILVVFARDINNLISHYKRPCCNYEKIKVLRAK